MKRRIFLQTAALAALSAQIPAACAVTRRAKTASKTMNIWPSKVSPNGHFLLRDDNSPFFYLADTAWELFHRCNREEADLYLRTRAKQGFTVVQAVALAEIDGLRVPNSLGDLPLHDDGKGSFDPARPNESYFQHVDYVVNRAAELGLTIGMLPTWGDKWNKAWGAGPEIFTVQNARVYGEFLGRRYRTQPIIWILGGDRPVENEAHRAILDAMAEGVHGGDGGAHLRSFHPMGGRGSSEDVGGAPWLDFQMWQSGHDRNKNNYDLIARDYAATPPKPTLDAEPGYEDHAASFNPDNGYLEAYDNRKALYWALFAGACGHTYGCHAIWQMWQPGRTAISWARTPWKDALQLPGASQMQHAKNLLLSRPYLSRVPDQSLIVGENKGGTYHVQAARDDKGRYALIYVPMQGSIEVKCEALRGDTLNVFWFDPRTGTATSAGTVKREMQTFTTPQGGPDWVLVLDDASAHFPIPGSKAFVGD